MEKTYNSKYIEQHWAKTWEQAGYFAPSGKGKPYCIVIPPPNITGNLHMGHGFQYSLMDTLTRYHRMQGFNTLWQVGLDHAGIATQMVVMQQLLSQGKDPYQLGREKFVQSVWEWKEKSGTTIQQQMRHMGISVDWNNERFTMDSYMSKAVQKVFIDLYDQGFIYRGKKLVNWDPVLNTAISDLEVAFEEQDGSLWYIKYPIEGERKKYLVVATTRPETMFGDTAVAVNPDDERYQDLIGKYARVPFTERRIPIIADETVDVDFGSGCVKVTPGHDFNDHEIGQKHDLPTISIFTSQAKLNENAPSVYWGMDRFEARKQIIHDLKIANLLSKIEPYKIKIPKCHRSDAIIEPHITDQWFVRTKLFAKPAMKVVTSGKIKFIPDIWSKTYLQWLENIEDWCISRQIWWGHKIPAWYDEQNNVYVGDNEVEVRNKYKLDKDLKLVKDEDVLDTWFSSAIWPFASLGWPDAKQQFKTFYPTNVLVTGFDIIFFWVARMVMMGLKFTGEVPFKEVYITGLIRDSQGQKMSKSKGNILDPIDLVEGISLEVLITKRTSDLMQPELSKIIAEQTRKEFPQGIKPYGMDALRFTFCALASTGRDINFDINRLEGYRNFCNKIWNASRFVLMNQNTKKDVYTLADRWILARLQITIREITKFISGYRFDLIAQSLHEFIWHEYCDWYLELCKAQQYIGSTMVEVLETLLRLIHPIMPFISEEIWQQVAPLTGKTGATIMLQPYPKLNKKQIDNKAIQEIEWLKKVVMGIRNIRSEMKIHPRKHLPLLLKKGSSANRKYIKNNQQYLMSLANLESITWLKDSDKVPSSATTLINELEVHVPLEKIIDKAYETDRLNKELAKLQKEIERIQNKLSNDNYLLKAPKDVIKKDQEKLKENLQVLDKLQKQLQLL